MTEHREPSRWDLLRSWTDRTRRRAANLPRRYPVTCIFLAFALLVGVGYWRTQHIADQRASDARDARKHDSSVATDQHRHDQALIACIDHWGHLLVRDLNERGQHSNPRLDKLFDAISVAIKHPNEHARTLRLTNRALALHEHYKRYSRTHPLPVPELHCELGPPPTRPTSSNRPGGPAPTRTVFVTLAPKRITRVVRIPGPTRTRVIVRTAVAPPGKHRGRHHGHGR